MSMEQTPRIADIQAAVAEEYGLRLIHMNSQRRARFVARPRQIAMFLAYDMTPQTLPMIGRSFDRDRTTVMHAIKTVEALAKADPEFAERVDRVRQRLLAE
jgi:chromosomal replication initiator protein